MHLFSNRNDEVAHPLKRGKHAHATGAGRLLGNHRAVYSNAKTRTERRLAAIGEQKVSCGNRFRIACRHPVGDAAARIGLRERR